MRVSLPSLSFEGSCQSSFDIASNDAYKFFGPRATGFFNHEYVNSWAPFVIPIRCHDVWTNEMQLRISSVSIFNCVGFPLNRYYLLNTNSWSDWEASVDIRRLLPPGLRG